MCNKAKSDQKNSILSNLEIVLIENISKYSTKNISQYSIKNISQYYNHTIVISEPDYIKSCEERNKNLDCISYVYLTKIGIPSKVDTSDIFDDKTISFHIENDDNTSFLIKSKAKIHTIDYVTCMFGALGAWIGFSFIGINPIPYLIQIKNTGNDILNVLDRKVLYREIIQSKNRMNTMENHIKQLIREKDKIEVCYPEREAKSIAAEKEVQKLINKLIIDVSRYQKSIKK